MSWWAWFFNTTAGAASIMSLILGAILGFVSWRISLATDKLIKQSSDDTHTLIKTTSEGTQALIAQTTASTQSILERMNQEGNQRQREMMEAIQALKR
jgi:tellurite resistance protein